VVRQNHVRRIVLQLMPKKPPASPHVLNGNLPRLPARVIQPHNIGGHVFTAKEYSVHSSFASVAMILN